ncbi:MAG: hypothetical protein QM784_20865 [Polyangiaceae bacterium]
MNLERTSTWVPSSLVRIRCFMNRRGMKVRPWLSPEALLDTFFEALQAQAKNGEFWTELEGLLANLSHDMLERIARRRWVIENELLDASKHAVLLGEIRRALERRTEPPRGLHRFAMELPTSAAALLLMFASAIVTGCGGDMSTEDDRARGGATTSTSMPAGGQSMGHGGTTGTGTGAAVEDGMGGVPGIIVHPECTTPSTSPPLDPAGFATCNPKLVEALIPYDIHSHSGKRLLECACMLNDAWQTGLADLFSDQDCDAIMDYLGCCGISRLCATADQPLPPEFDPNLLLDNSCCLIYLGVRCD